MKRFFLCAVLAGLAVCAARGQSVFINEIVASSGTAPLDEDGDKPDWIELHNPGAEAVNLLGWGLSDNATRPFKWVFGNAEIPAGGFMVVFASGKDRHPEAPVAMAPDTIPGLKVWLDARQFNVSDSAQARATINGAFVRRANDLSGNLNHASQAADANQPLWIANGLNGGPCFRFDGANDMLVLPRRFTDNFCVFAVIRTSAAHEIDAENNAGVGGVSGQRYLFGAQHGGDFGAGAGLSVGVNGVSVYEHGSGYMPAVAVSGAPIGNGSVLVSFNYTGRRPEVNVNSLLARAGVLSARSQVTSPVEIGAGYYGAFLGDVGEVLIYDRSLTVEESRGIAGYLMTKHGIPVTAPQHTSWQLSADGEDVVLTRPDASRADRVTFGAMPRDVSYGRQPDDTGPLLFFAQPTPGAANLTPGSTEYLLPPVFSQAAGFYASTVTVELSSATLGAQIRYTLDGSEPTGASALYGGPLTLASRALAPNDLSNIPTAGDWQAPAGTVFKGWVLRAAAFKDGALPSSVVTRSYFIEPRGRSRYSVPVVSLATDRANFFSPDTGIYVVGNAPGANFSQRGEGWERPIHAEFFETDNSIAFAQDGDVKIHGNTSQNFRIKGLDLDGTGGRGGGPFRHRIFPARARTEFEHFLLRPSGHDHHMSFMRDEFMQALAAETGSETQAARLCAVFLNGEYWGLHYLKEKEDAEFVSFYGNAPMDSIDYLEGYAAARAGDTAHYEAMLQFMRDNDLSRAENYAEVERRMEVASYIDYKACEIFFYRWDIGNHRFWRPKTPEGRWRWLQFDNDVGWGGFWTSYPAWTFDMLSADLTPNGGLYGHATETTTFLLRRLLTNPEFKRAFINRFADLMNSVLRSDRAIAKIDEHAARIEPEMAEHARRWGAPASLPDWRNFVQQLRDYANNRPVYVRQHIASQFGLQGNAQLSASISRAEAGIAWVNTLAVTNLTASPWLGLYFRGNPISLRAEAKPGYRFVGWLGAWEGRRAENPLELALAANNTVTASFASESELAPRFTGGEILPEGGARFRFQGFAGARYTLESSDDLEIWREGPVCSTDAAGIGEIEVGAAPARFWKLRFVE